MSDFSKIIREVKTVYQWIDEQVGRMAQSCQGCGDCCDFERFGHRLYITTPEMLHFQHHAAPPIKTMSAGVCPYRVEGKCSVYPYRFSGCRIFSCRGDTEEENALCEQAVRKFKILCNEHGLDYQYVSLQAGLEMIQEDRFKIQH